MTRVLVMGPSEWDPARGEPPFDLAPLTLRRHVAALFAEHGVQAALMEDVPDQAGEDILDKFRRLTLRSGVDAAIVVWPPRAKMQTTYDEILLLREWRDVAPPVWLIHHVTAVRRDRRQLELLEPGGRSRYLDAVAGLEPLFRPWSTLFELDWNIRQVIDHVQAAPKPPAAPRATGSATDRPDRSGS